MCNDLCRNFTMWSVSLIIADGFKTKIQGSTKKCVSPRDSDVILSFWSHRTVTAMIGM